jgi:hypothetical protein
MDGTAAVAVQRAWRACASRRSGRAARALRDAACCVVCGDECALVVRCHAGHACCTGCVACVGADLRCPVCRQPRPLVPDASFARALDACGVRLRCGGCGAHTPARRTEAHRAWCPAHAFVCPCDGCTRALATRDGLAAHVRSHARVHAPLRAADGAVHAVVALDARTPHPSRVVLVVCSSSSSLPLWSPSAASVVVVLTSAPEGRPTLLRVTAHAYYPSAECRPLRATLRTMTVTGADDAEGWTEEHRLGVVPPVLASREALAEDACAVSALLSPRCAWYGNAVALHPRAPLLAVSSARPGHVPLDLAARATQAGIRDVPSTLSPLARSHELMMRPPVALVHVALRLDPRGAPTIGALYPE